MSNELAYPTESAIRSIHDDVVTADAGSDSGIRASGEIQSALHYVSEGYFDEVPETIHEKATHLIRLLTVSHPFVDGNKRTALATADVFYAANGYVFEYDHEVRSILKSFATDEAAVDMGRVTIYCHDHATRIQSSGIDEAAYDPERAELREMIRTADSVEERDEAFRRLTAIGRERHTDIYERLARE